MTFGDGTVKVAGNIITFILPAAALDEVGIVIAQLQLYAADNKRLSVCNFKYTVKDVINN